MKHALTPGEPVFTRKIRNIILGPNSCIAPGFFSGLSRVSVGRSFEGFECFTKNYEHTPQAC
jgi:hypothetical protein